MARRRIWVWALTVLLVGVPAVAAADWVFWVNEHTDELGIIDSATNEIVAQIQVGRHPHRIAVAPDGRTVYTANEKSRD
ncbi:MAG: YncE family protein, partial [Candidatus Methylomirabilales bacterium]